MAPRQLALALLLGIFLLALVGQSLAGVRIYNEEALERDRAISYWRYLYSSHFGQATLENWQSEYLQFALFVYMSIWLVQRGSNESKELDQVGRESDRRQRVGGWSDPRSPRPARARGGFGRWLYSNSLMLVMLLVFLGSWGAQSVTGWTEYHDDQRDHGPAGVSWPGYVTTPDFSEDTLQNWQSEFLAVGSMAIFTVYLRQRGSPESKPVGARHDETAASG